MEIKYFIILLILFLLYIFIIKKDHFLNSDTKVFVSYIYYEKKISKENFKYFLNNGGIIESDNIDYIITINGNKCSLELPKFKNVKYIFRENKCYDIGSHGLSLKNIDINKYDYFFFINDTVKGPYIKNKKTNWIDFFTSKINNKCKLFGTEIYKTKKLYTGFPPKLNKKNEQVSFVGSMFLCTDKIGLNIIKPYMTCMKTHGEAVHKGEHLISDAISQTNYEIGAILNKHYLYYDTKKYKYDTIFYKVNNACKQCKNKF